MKALQESVELGEAALVEGHSRPGLQHALLALQARPGREGAQEGCQALRAATLQEHLADACHLLGGEAGRHGDGGGGGRSAFDGSARVWRSTV